jgi:hypothetical protein
VLIARSSLRGQRARFVSLSPDFNASAWVAIDKESQGQALTKLASYTDQNRAPRKLVPLSWLTPITE